MPFHFDTKINLGHIITISLVAVSGIAFVIRAEASHDHLHSEDVRIEQKFDQKYIELEKLMKSNQALTRKDVENINKNTTRIEKNFENLINYLIEKEKKKSL